jgi:uncharacterized membrane protein
MGDAVPKRQATHATLCAPRHLCECISTSRRRITDASRQTCQPELVAPNVVERYRRDDAEFDRAIAFIDATFAVALTLLVTTLDLKSDPASWDSLGHFYDAMGSQLVAFAISFVVIALYWVSHYRLVATFDALDLRLLVLNLFLLAAIVILPFTTESAGDPNVDHLPLPAAVLSVNLAAVSIAFTLIYVIARDRGLLRVEHSQREFRWRTALFLAPGIVFLASIPVAYAVDPATARLVWLSLLVINPLLGTRMNRALQAERASTDDGSH